MGAWLGRWPSFAGGQRSRLPLQWEGPGRYNSAVLLVPDRQDRARPEEKTAVADVGEGKAYRVALCCVQMRRNVETGDAFG